MLADVPSDTLSPTNIGVPEASTYTSTFADSNADSKVADAVQTHSMSINLRDQYGNPVINVP